MGHEISRRTTVLWASGLLLFSLAVGGGCECWENVDAVSHMNDDCLDQFCAWKEKCLDGQYELCMNDDTYNDTDNTCAEYDEYWACLCGCANSECSNEDDYDSNAHCEGMCRTNHCEQVAE